MAHFCLMVVGKDIENLLSLLYRYNERNLEQKIFKKEMNYAEMLNEYNSTQVEKGDLYDYAMKKYQYVYDGESHSFGIFTNPNAKFSEFKLGGRFLNNIMIKNSVQRRFFGFKQDIDMDGMILEAKQKAIKFKKFLELENQISEEDFVKNFGGDEENILQYISDYCQPSFFYEGVWHDKTEFSNEEWNDKFTRFFNSLPDNESITLLDCHK